MRRIVAPGRADTDRRRDGHALELAGEDGIRAAYRAHGDELYRFAVRRLHDEGAAQEAVQEVFLRAWRHAERFDPEIASLRVWLFAIARNVVVDGARRRRARPDVPTERDDLLAMVETVPEFDDDVLTVQLLEVALDALSAEHRTALVETYLRGRSYAEVAAEESIPVGTLRSRIFYALKALRSQVDRMGEDR